MDDHSFDKLPKLSLDVRWISKHPADGIVLSELTFQATEDQRRTAYLVCPEGEGPFPVILYVHWYEPHACDSNRTQFLEEAKQMASYGVMSLLVETMWSDREWFLKRTQADDIVSSIQQTIELRRAMDLLLFQPDADPMRFAYVGHDFGAMYGALAGSIDARPTRYVLMAGTLRFSDWYLYYPQLDGADCTDFIEQIKFLDPIERVGQLSPAPILFQFGNDDLHVPIERAHAFADAAGHPTDTLSYDAGHGLNEDATRDRIAWLGKQLSV